MKRVIAKVGTLLLALQVTVLLARAQDKVTQLERQQQTVDAQQRQHIGLQSLESRQDSLQAGLTTNVQQAMKWMSAFGEGEAMLAAVGTVDKHPHWEDDSLVRARWDSDMMHFNNDLIAVQELLLDILDSRLKTEAEIRKRAIPFWGMQGAWYTVGYEMSVLVEMRFGREAFNQCLLDPRKLLVLYNKVAAEANAKGAALNLWSTDLLAKLGTPYSKRSRGAIGAEPLNEVCLPDNLENDTLSSLVTLFGTWNRI